MPFMKAGRMEDLPEGSMREVPGMDPPIVICNVNGELHAMDGVCPHRSGPLAMGALNGTSVVCPWHAWEFDCTTGACDMNDAVLLKRYPVKVQDGDILVDLPTQ